MVWLWVCTCTLNLYLLAYVCCLCWLSMLPPCLQKYYWYFSGIVAKSNSRSVVEVLLGVWNPKWKSLSRWIVLVLKVVHEVRCRSRPVLEVLLRLLCSVKAKVKVVTNFKPQAKVLASNESINRSINEVKDSNDCHFALEFDCGKKRCLHHIPVDDLLYVGIVVFIIVVFILVFILIFVVFFIVTPERFKFSQSGTDGSLFQQNRRWFPQRRKVPDILYDESDEMKMIAGHEHTERRDRR